MIFDSEIYPNRFKPVYGLIFKSGNTMYYFSGFNLLEATADSKKWWFRSLSENDSREYCRTVKELLDAMDQKKIVSCGEFMKNK